MPLAVRDWIPMRWPQGWGPPHHRQISRGAINCLVMDEPRPDVISAYKADGIVVTTLKDAGVTLVPGCKWPKVQTGAGGDSADAGPTGVPWVDSNGYAVQLTRALHPDRPVWLDYGPPADHNITTVDNYRLAICDAAAYGGRWVVRADEAMLPGLNRTLNFFAQHSDWQAYRPTGKLAVVSDFAGANRSLAMETLNLLPRRRVPYVVIPENAVVAADLTGFAAILWIHKERDGPAASRMNSFAKQGGLLIQPQSEDPFEVVVETQTRMGRRHDVLRMWNDGSLNAHCTASANGRDFLVQLINYSAAKSSDAVTLGLVRPYKSAVLYTLDDEPKEISIRTVRSGIELQLPPFPVYAAISLKT